MQGFAFPLQITSEQQITRSGATLLSLNRRIATHLRRRPTLDQPPSLTYPQGKSKRTRASQANFGQGPHLFKLDCRLSWNPRILETKLDVLRLPLSR